MQNYDYFLLANVLGKGFLTDNLGHAFLVDTRMEPLSAQKKKKKKIRKITTWLEA